jgi:HEAT repeat protein
MGELKKTGFTVCLGLALFAVMGFGGSKSSSNPERGLENEVVRHIAVLKSGKAQEKAAAAYWLGQQRSAATAAVNTLVELLGDATEVNSAQYRQRRLDKMTLGEEVAAALVNIGSPSIEPLIKVLKTSPQPEARKNAAWALGALHDTGATASQI